jgi:hypothetical protein
MDTNCSKILSYLSLIKHSQKSYVYKDILKTDSITCYLFNYDSIKNIPWSRIRDEKIYVKKVVFHSWEEMEACNFTIIYP